MVVNEININVNNIPVLFYIVADVYVISLFRREEIPFIAVIVHLGAFVCVGGEELNKVFVKLSLAVAVGVEVKTAFILVRILEGIFLEVVLIIIDEGEELAEAVCYGLLFAFSEVGVEIGPVCSGLTGAIGVE